MFLLVLMFLSMLAANLPSLIYAKQKSPWLFLTGFIGLMIQLLVVFGLHVMNWKIVEPEYIKIEEHYRGEDANYNDTTNEKIVSGTVWTEHPEENTGLGWVL